MISPQHVDYIRFQTGRGVSREEITNSLRLNGVTDEDIQDGFAQMIANPSVMTVSGAVPAHPGINSRSPVSSVIWGKAIPTTNSISLALWLLVLLTVDLYLILGSGLTLIIFLIPMLIQVGMAVLAIKHERKLAQEFSSSTNVIDKWLLVLIALRNLVVLLSVIPFIQIIGVGLWGVGLIPYLISHELMVRYRKKHTPTVA